MPLFLPHPALRDRVASIEVVEDGAAEVEVLPGSAVVLGFQFRGRVRAPEGLLATAGVTGLQRGVRRYAYLDRASSVLVRFTPQGAAALGAPVSELTGRSVALDELLPPALVREAGDRVCEAVAAGERVAAVERLLLALPFARDAAVARALAIIEGPPEDGAPLVRTVATTLGLSERQLERRFARQVGVGPKHYAALRRFERALVSAKTGRLTETALAAGYYDQPHFNREFRRFTGQAPGAFFRERG